MRSYLIKSGFSFRIDADTVLTGGSTINLEDDVARVHAEKVELIADGSPAAVAAPAFPQPDGSLLPEAPAPVE